MAQNLGRERFISAQIGIQAENPLLKDLENALKPVEAESVEKVPSPDLNKLE